MKFCKNCGRVIGDNEQCPCTAADGQDVFAAQQQGVPVQQAPGIPGQQMPQYGGYPQTPPAGYAPAAGYPVAAGTAAAAAKPKKKTGLLVLLILLVLCIIGGGIWYFAFYSGGYEEPVKQLFKGINSKNYKTANAPMMTDHFFRYAADNYFDGSMSDCKSAYNDFCSEESLEMREFFADCEDEWNVSNIKYSYSIQGKSKLSKSDLRDIEDDYEQMYEENDLREGYELTVKVTVKGGGKSDSATGYMMVVKTGSEGWKLVPDSADSFSFSTFDGAEDLIEECLEF